jgi:hypothetical protein
VLKSAKSSLSSHAHREAGTVGVARGTVAPLLGIRSSHNRSPTSPYGILAAATPPKRRNNSHEVQHYPTAFTHANDGAEQNAVPFGENGEKCLESN